MIRGPLQRVLHVLGVGFSSFSAWLIRDEFEDSDTSPINSPRAAIPGPGTLDFTETDGSFSIGSGILEFSTPTSPAYDVLRFESVDSFSRNSGRSLVVSIQIDSGDGAYLYFSDSSSDPATLDDIADGLCFYFEAAGEIHIVLASGISLAESVGTWVTGVPYKIGITQYDEGALYEIKGGTYTDWTALFVNPEGIAGDTYPAFTDYGADGSLAYFRFWDAPASSFEPSFSVTPGQFTQSLTATQITDGGFELWNSPTDLSNWTENLVGIATVNQESSDIDAGVYAARLDTDLILTGISVSQSLPAGSSSDYYEVLGYVKSEPLGESFSVATEGDTYQHTLGDTYKPYTDLLLTNDPSPTLILTTDATNSSIYLDNFSARRVVRNALQSTPADSIIDFEFILPDTPSGFMLMQAMDENFFLFLYRLVLGLLKTLLKQG